MSKTLGTLTLVLLAAVIGSRFGKRALTSNKTTTQRRQRPVLCPVEQECRKRVHREFLALDLLKNSTEHEEYRPS